MPRIRRHLVDGLAYHILNRGNRKQQVFFQDADYEEFLNTTADAIVREPIGLLAFVVMPTHFHFVVCPAQAIAIPAFMCWFMNAHIRRHHRWRETWGTGHLYQGRYKSFPIQTNHHLLTVLRYVEANASRARLCERAETWPWSSLAAKQSPDGRDLLVPSPVDRPDNWLSVVNEPLSLRVQLDLRAAAQRQLPFGEPAWARELAEKGTVSPPR